MKDIINNIFSIESESDFTDTALKLFDYQIKNNNVYANYIKLLGINLQPTSINEIPFLPISLFKKEKIKCSNKREEKIFYSSGTTKLKSKHIIQDLSIYDQAYKKSFNSFYGDISEYCFLALLPSYKENESSSLIYMMDGLINQSKNHNSGYYLRNYKELNTILKTLEKNKQKTILFGVTYALIEFAKLFPQHLKNTIVMETGGMKGKRKEMHKQEVHSILKKSFSIEKIHSEYSMTELLSQAYSKGENIFNSPAWMKILIRDINDPLSIIGCNKTGAINIIDLANIYSCPFIATEDCGQLYNDNSFSVIGRLSETDIRGCNLLIA